MILDRPKVRLASLGFFGAVMLLGGSGCGALHHRREVPPQPRGHRDGGDVGFHSEPRSVSPAQMGQTPVSAPPTGAGAIQTGQPYGAGPGASESSGAPLGEAPGATVPSPNPFGPTPVQQ